MLGVLLFRDNANDTERHSWGSHSKKPPSQRRIPDLPVISHFPGCDLTSSLLDLRVARGYITQLLSSSLSPWRIPVIVAEAATFTRRSFDTFPAHLLPRQGVEVAGDCPSILHLICLCFRAFFWICFVNFQTAWWDLERFDRFWLNHLF